MHKSAFSSVVTDSLMCRGFPIGAGVFRMAYPTQHQLPVGECAGPTPALPAASGQGLQTTGSAKSDGCVQVTQVPLHTRQPLLRFVCQ